MSMSRYVLFFVMLPIDLNNKKITQSSASTQRPIEPSMRDLKRHTPLASAVLGGAVHLTNEVKQQDRLVRQQLAPLWSLVASELDGLSTLILDRQISKYRQSKIF